MSDRSASGPHRTARHVVTGTLAVAAFALALIVAASGRSRAAAAVLTPTVTVTPTPTALATPDAVDECVACLPPTATVVTDLNVRRGPGVDYAVLGTLRSGTTILITGVNADGTWLQVVYPAGADGRGWIARRYATVSGDLASVAVVAAPTPTPTITPTPTPTPTEAAAPGADAATGWLGEYFDNLYLNDPAVLVRLDPVLDFNWADRAPAPGLPADDF